MLLPWSAIDLASWKSDVVAPRRATHVSHGTEIALSDDCPGLRTATVHRPSFSRIILSVPASVMGFQKYISIPESSQRKINQYHRWCEPQEESFGPGRRRVSLAHSISRGPTTSGGSSQAAGAVAGRARARRAGRSPLVPQGRPKTSVFRVFGRVHRPLQRMGGNTLLKERIERAPQSPSRAP